MRYLARWLPLGAHGWATRWRRPPRPPLGAPDTVLAFSAVTPSDRFISGNAIASRCRYVLSYDELAVNEAVENDWWFCKADFLEYFFQELAPNSPFVLFSHNSDRPIDRRFARQLRRQSFTAWFGANVALAHPKLFAVPLGIANPVWPHGDAQALESVQAAGIKKTRMFDVSFSVETNRSERLRCLELTGLEVDAPTAFPEYLERLASSYFCLSPRGNGVDTHRTWEALYVGTIPVVTRSVLTDQHEDLPWIVLDDWSQFRSIDFSPELYARVWGDWRPDELGLDRYLQRVDRTLGAIRSGRLPGQPGKP